MLRVVVPETEAEWIERARTVSSRVLERDVTASRMGDAPPEPGREKDPAQRRMVIRGATAHIQHIHDYLHWARTQAGVCREEVDLMFDAEAVRSK